MIRDKIKTLPKVEQNRTDTILGVLVPLGWGTFYVYVDCSVLY